MGFILRDNINHLKFWCRHHHNSLISIRSYLGNSGLGSFVRYLDLVWGMEAVIIHQLAEGIREKLPAGHRPLAKKIQVKRKKPLLIGVNSSGMKAKTGSDLVFFNFQFFYWSFLDVSRNGFSRKKKKSLHISISCSPQMRLRVWVRSTCRLHIWTQQPIIPFRSIWLTGPKQADCARYWNIQPTCCWMGIRGGKYKNGLRQWSHKKS